MIAFCQSSNQIIFLYLDLDGATAKLAEQLQTKLDKFDRQMKTLSKQLHERTVRLKNQISTVDYSIGPIFAGESKSGSLSSRRRNIPRQCRKETPTVLINCVLLNLGLQ